ncbi:MAG: TatD family hydrolase [Alistipes sp.]|nr:TatD family hydrolase [Alistipes sp.]
MRLTDTHSHLYDEAFDADRAEVLERALQSGVERLLLPAIDSESHAALHALCREHPECCVPMMGLHPTSVNENPRWREELLLVEEYLRMPPIGLTPYCAVGEIGLDFYWSTEYCEEQIEAFRTQCRWAAELDLPVAIHTRAAWDAMCSIIEEECAAARARGQRLRGLFHAYSEGAEVYERLRKTGEWLFGIGGVVTYKKSIVAEAVKAMRLEEIVLETDCPYLTPVPHRGQRNEPSYVVHTCNKVAELLCVTPEEVAEQTSRNVERMFFRER